MKKEIDGDPFDSISREAIERELNSFSGTAGSTGVLNGDCTYSNNDIFVFKTDEKRCAKLQIVGSEKAHEIGRQHCRTLYVRYVVYRHVENPVDPENPPPVLQSIGDKSVDENVPLTFSINSTDPNGEPITYLVEDLPNGATFSGQVFSWTPNSTQAGNYKVKFIASDGNSQDFEIITITVNNVN